METGSSVAWLSFADDCGVLSTHLLTEGPLEQCVALAPHDDEEQGKMRSAARAVAIEV